MTHPKHIEKIQCPHGAEEGKCPVINCANYTPSETTSERFDKEFYIEEDRWTNNTPRPETIKNFIKQEQLRLIEAILDGKKYYFDAEMSKAYISVEDIHQVMKEWGL